MTNIDTLRIIGASDRFQPVRDSAGRVVCGYDAATRQVRVTKRNGKVVIATLPDADRPSEPEDQRQHI